MLSSAVGTIITIIILTIAFLVMCVFFGIKKAFHIMLLAVIGCILCSMVKSDSESLDAVFKIAFMFPAFALLTRTGFEKFDKRVSM